MKRSQLELECKARESILRKKEHFQRHRNE